MQPSVVFVLSNVQNNFNIRNPVNQHGFVEKHGFADKVHYIVAKKDKIECKCLTNNHRLLLFLRYRTRLIFEEIVRHEYVDIIRMDQGYDVLKIPNLVSSVNGAPKFGNTSVVQLKFISKDELDRAVKHGTKIEYGLFRVTLPIEKPMPCHNRQDFGHFF